MVNTGGSSGESLNFYILPSSIPLEWAHMHTIWEVLGFRTWKPKLYFGGRNYNENSYGDKTGIKFNSPRGIIKDEPDEENSGNA